MIAGQPLTVEEVVDVARNGRRVELAEDAKGKLDRSRAVVERAAAGDKPVYGINTGFGSLSRVKIEPSEVREIQRNLLRSHAAGVGEPLPEDVVRAMLLLLAASLARGRSGVRPALIEQIIALLNHRICPVVPSRGSVGASGDLAPLAHAALVLIGEGEAGCRDGLTVNGAEALGQAGLMPITLEAKEGLALINGTHMMTAIAAIALSDVRQLIHAALLSAAMSIDACRATDAFLDDRLHEARNQKGQRRVAAHLRELLTGSQIVTCHKENDPRVQDPYCLRAMPQVIGAAVDAIEHAGRIIEDELGAVTDNPLVFSDDVGGADQAAAIISGGNFHGMPMAISLDLLPIALSHVAGIAERRIFWLLSAFDLENPVQPYLSPKSGLHSGLMIAQYTAAACCNELQTLCTPASVANIPTSAGIEDYNSMGATAAHQCRAAIDLARQVIAIELLVMCEGMEYQRPRTSGEAVEAAHRAVRSAVAPLTGDRPPAPDIASIVRLIRDGRLVGIGPRLPLEI